LVDTQQLAKPQPHTAVWGAPLPPHTLENVGSDVLRVLSIEIKPSLASGDAPPNTSLQRTSPRSAIWRL
jgi:hypothetical protein